MIVRRSHGGAIGYKRPFMSARAARMVNFVATVSIAAAAAAAVAAAAAAAVAHTELARAHEKQQRQRRRRQATAITTSVANAIESFGLLGVCKRVSKLYKLQRRQSTNAKLQTLSVAAA